MGEFHSSGTLDGDIVYLDIDPELEPTHSVTLSVLGYTITFTTESEEWSRKLYEVLQHTRIVSAE